MTVIVVLGENSQKTLIFFNCLLNHYCRFVAAASCLFPSSSLRVPSSLALPSFVFFSSSQSSSAITTLFRVLVEVCLLPSLFLCYALFLFLLFFVALFFFFFFHFSSQFVVLCSLFDSFFFLCLGLVLFPLFLLHSVCNGKKRCFGVTWFAKTFLTLQRLYKQKHNVRKVVS